MRSLIILCLSVVMGASCLTLAGCSVEGVEDYANVYCIMLQDCHCIPPDISTADWGAEMQEVWGMVFQDIDTCRDVVAQSHLDIRSRCDGPQFDYAAYMEPMRDVYRSCRSVTPENLPTCGSVVNAGAEEWDGFSTSCQP